MDEIRKALEASLFHLKSKGIEITHGVDVDESNRPLSQTELNNFKELTKLSLPTKFESYLLEFGFGNVFNYEYSDENDTSTFGLGLSCLKDVEAEWEEVSDIFNAILSGNGEAYGIPNDDAESIKNAEIRKNWLPIYDIGNGGYVLSIDTSTPGGAIVYQDINYGFSGPESRSIIVAKSFEEWILKWSHYCFSNPVEEGDHCFWASFVGYKTGEFDWDESNFISELRR